MNPTNRHRCTAQLLSTFQCHSNRQPTPPSQPLTKNALRLGVLSCLLSCSPVSFAGEQPTVDQPPAVPTATTKSDAPVEPLRQPLETWLGWIEAPETHLRWFVQFQKDSKGNLQGSSLTPEALTKPIPLSKLDVSGDAWNLEWTDPITNQLWKYVGKKESTDKVTGLLVIGPQTIAVPLVRAGQLPPETKETLGADIVWTDSQPSIGANQSANPFDFRFRFYTQPPYTSDKPRILFDSVAKNLIGKPVEFRRDEDGTLEFSIPAIQAEYRAILAAEDTMAGTFRRKEAASPLEMKLWKPKGKGATDSKKESPKSSSVAPPPNSDSDASKKEKTSDAESVRITMDATRIDSSVRDLAPNETAFVLDLNSASGRRSRKSTPAPATLGCTITVPEAKQPNPCPVVILLSTYGQQDRDGTQGTFKPYREMAQWLASQGIASVRFDDRGVGGSSPPEPDFTPTRSLDDLQALFGYLSKDSRFDTKRIGLIGHGEGAATAVAAASTNPNIAFLILLAPPGVSGSDLLISQSKLLAKIEGMAEKNQSIMESIQRKLHGLVRASLSKDSALKEVQQLVQDHWDGLKASIEGEKTALEWSQIRKQLENQLMSDYENLQSAWSKEFLFNEPATNWMLLQCPVLAVWGERDMQIIPDVNRPKIESAVARGSAKSFRLEQIIGLNHWLQKAPTESNLEVEENAPISKELLQAIESWVAAQL
ncbi:MAG: alpha/beta hydrolase [Pirellula sp.]|nr:alpha/beta hydrolase [Pirellula sp.]